VTATYAYDSFGVSTGTTGTTTNPYRYTGREFDSVTGLQYNRARYYDPQTGRWLEQDVLGFNVQAAGTRGALFGITCVVLAASLAMCRAIVTSKFGKVLVAIRDAESRTRFLGYRVESYKLLVFTLSACMAGVAGALYVLQVGIINPSEFAPANSIEEVIWVAVGGRGTLTGAILGAVVVNYGKTSFTSGALAPYWLFVLGGLFVGVTLLLPRGIVGTIQHLWANRRKPETPDPDPEPVGAPAPAE